MSIARSPAAHVVRHDEPFDLEFGGRLDRLEIAYETWGRLDDSAGNAILICPAFSAHSHARSSAADPSKGWWEKMIGRRRGLDTQRFFVICASLLGGCHGTTGPLEPRADGRPWRGDFPVVSPRDMARAHALVVKHLGIERLHAVIGSSMGAMQALELAILEPDLTERVLAISGTAWTRPATAAIRHLGRKAIMSDPEWRDGHYEGAGPVAGLRLARELGTVFYRSKAEFDARFHHEPIHPPSLRGVTFDVQSYLNHQGLKTSRRFDANAYLYLSLAMDLHDLARGRGSLVEALATTSARFLVGGVVEDRLIPLAEQQEIRDAAIAAGRDVRWFETSSAIGHDAFLVEIDAFAELMAPIL